MIINNTHLRGIFLWDPEVEYERGDFVVSGTTLYTCTADYPTDIERCSVKGIKPEDSEGKNFVVYLGDKVTGIEEFNAYRDSLLHRDTVPVGEDKYVSSSVLGEVLNSIMFGVNDSGIISESIISESEYTTGVKEAISEVSGSNVLDRVLESDSINNGMVRISRDLLQGLIPLPTNQIEGIDSRSVILKQYSYFEDSRKMRVQEIIDHVSGIVIYRYGRGTLDSSGVWVFDTISLWKRSFLNKSYLDDVNAVYKWCTDKILSLEAEKKELIGSFRYRTLQFPKSDTVKLKISDFSGISDFSKDCIITLEIQSFYTPDVFKMSGITINLADSVNDSINNYYVDKNILLTISDISNTEMTLRVTSGKITDIYYRQNYE